jgi:hypothetical protein
MNAYVAFYPSGRDCARHLLFSSSNDWDYDFQNVPELRGTDFWSEGGATGLYWTKYEMGAAAMRKIALESPDFYRRFNAEYCARINANPMVVRPTRALIVDIIQTLVPQIEGRPAAEWVNGQNIFYAQNVYGKKIFHRIQDYPYVDLFAFQDLYFMETMPCGSEWACWDGTQWVYHRLNGASGSGRLLNAAGSTVWSGSLQIQPTQNPSDGYFGIGHARKSLTTATSLLPWPGGSENDYVMNLRTFGLYKFESTFIDPATQVSTTNSISRVMGGEIANNFTGVWGGVLGHTTGTIYLNHQGRGGARHPRDQRRVRGDSELGRGAERAHRWARLGAGPCVRDVRRRADRRDVHRAAQHRLRQRERQSDVPVRLHREWSGHRAADCVDLEPGQRREAHRDTIAASASDNVGVMGRFSVDGQVVATDTSTRTPRRGTRPRPRWGPTPSRPRPTTRPGTRRRPRRCR